MFRINDRVTPRDNDPDYYDIGTVVALHTSDGFLVKVRWDSDGRVNLCRAHHLCVSYDERDQS